jgi:hypothetical protein
MCALQRKSNTKFPMRGWTRVGQQLISSFEVIEHLCYEYHIILSPHFRLAMVTASFFISDTLGSRLVRTSGTYHKNRNDVGILDSLLMHPPPQRTVRFS